MLKKGESARYEWNHEGKGEHMVFDSLSGLLRIKLLVNINFDDVVDNDKTTYDNSLSNFNTVNSSIDVNGISAENSNVTHINIVYYTKIKVVTEDWS